MIGMLHKMTLPFITLHNVHMHYILSKPKKLKINLEQSLVICQFFQSRLYKSLKFDCLHAHYAYTMAKHRLHRRVSSFRSGQKSGAEEEGGGIYNC